MDVRLLRPTDAPVALALSIDADAHLVRSASHPTSKHVAATLARAAVPVAVSGRAWIARDDKSVALLEAIPRRYVIGWDIERLAYRGDGDRVLGPIVQECIDHLRRRGVPRLFVRCSPDSVPELQTVGFHPLAREYVLLRAAAGPDPEAPPPPHGSRYRMPQDSWPLHRLESGLTPPLLRQLEGLTSMDWTSRKREMSEIVVERDGQVVSWIGWGVKADLDARRVGMLLHSARADLGSDLLMHAVGTYPSSRFVARVRDYQLDVLNAFLEAGFVIVAEEVVMVRHARVEVARATRKRLRMAAPASQLIHNRWQRAEVSANSTSSEGELREQRS